MQGCRSFGRVIPGVVLVSGARRRVGLANNFVANLLSPAARAFMVASLGALVHKPSQLPDELGARPIGIDKCDLRSFTAPHVRDVT